MQLPISIGTILQNRYRIVDVLGQGGFGRTYLAEDQGRFRELCALKEFIPAQTGEYVLQKSQELFQREAEILYQIQHPQIPQFRATFEQDQRLFLVQDYVQGKTFHALLDERKARGFAFSEAEVMQFLQQMLPVLAHIHAKGIIHRDISPDNIILREQDLLPVLIDFGVVKEIATRIHLGGTAPQATTVGKLGYAPPEQMQTGRAYPSSDLYALAVTAIVLLTGREPQELFNEATLTWHWQRWVAVNAGFAQILNQMLSPRTTDRYQSVAEVARALQNLNTAAAAPLPSPQAPPDPAVSQMATIAVGRKPTDPAAPTPNSTEAYVPTPRVRSLWDDPLTVFSIGTALALAAGFGSWAIVSTLLTPSAPTPSPSESPIASTPPTLSPSPTPSPTPTPSPSPVSYSQRLRIAPGSSRNVDGTLRANQTVSYIVAAEEGQSLSASIGGEGVLLTILGPNDQPLEGSDRVNRWSGPLPYTGDYKVQLRTVKGLSKGDYKLTLALQAAPSPSPTPSASPSPPTVDVQPVEFPPDQTSTQVTGQTNPTTVKRYLVNVKPGQTLRVEAVRGTVTLDIRYPDGRLVEDASGLALWESQVTGEGRYQIDVIAVEDTDYTLSIGVSDGSNSPEPTPSPSP